MNRSITLCGFALAALLGLGFPTAAGESLPFKGSASETITDQVGNVITTDGAGVATHLGNFTRHAVVTLDGGSVIGTVVFTAANGDELWLDLAGGFTSATTVGGVYTITGGTGRFTGASGSADFSAAFTGPATLSLTFEGTIQY